MTNQDEPTVEQILLAARAGEFEFSTDFEASERLVAEWEAFLSRLLRERDAAVLRAEEYRKAWLAAEGETDEANRRLSQLRGLHAAVVEQRDEARATLETVERFRDESLGHALKMEARIQQLEDALREAETALHRCVEDGSDQPAVTYFDETRPYVATSADNTHHALSDQQEEG